MYNEGTYSVVTIIERMKHRNVAALVVAFAIVILTAPAAQAATVADSLARMDAIIAEMQKLRAEFALLAALPTTPAGSGAVLGAQTTAVLTKDLSVGATNSDIERIQKLLATDNEIYGDGTISGFFGPKTQDAIRRFQTRFKLAPVGVVGPGTKAILEAFMQKYPNDTYPVGVLKGSVPVVAPVVTPPVVVPTTPTPTVSSVSGMFTTIKAMGDGEEYDVTVVYSDGRANKTFVAQVRGEADVANVVAKKLGVDIASVKAVLSVKTGKPSASSDDEGDADDALNDAEDAIDEAQDAIDEADDNGDDTSDAEDLLDEANDTLDDANDAYDDEDYEEAIDLAKEAEDLANEAMDEL